jgi:catechol 2,3-dioxygenase-like lactoylglutathione lyase family enzyme
LRAPELAGMHHIKLPVTNVERSRTWYERVFGLHVIWEFPDDEGVVRGLAGTVPGLGDTLLALRENVSAAHGSRAFDFVGFAINDRADAERWVEWLDQLGIDHSPVIDASEGWLVVFRDPDDIEIHLYSWEKHGLDQSRGEGYGRRATSS